MKTNKKTMSLAALLIGLIMATMHFITPGGQAPEDHLPQVDSEPSLMVSSTARRGPRAETISTETIEEFKVIIQQKGEFGIRSAIVNVDCWATRNGTDERVWVKSTNESGELTFRTEEFPLRLIARSSGFLGAAHTIWKPGEKNHTIKLTLEQLARIVPEITDPAGRALDDALLELTYGLPIAAKLDMLELKDRPRSQTARFHFRQSTCVLGGIVPGVKLRFKCRHPKRGLVSGEIEPLKAGEHRGLPIVFKDRGGFVIKVLDQFSNPVPGAVVTSFRRSSEGRTAQAKSTTDATGIAELTGLDAGSHFVTAVGWNASLDELYLLGCDLFIEADQVLTGHELRAQDPSIEFELGAEGIEALGSRVASFFVSFVRHDPHEDRMPDVFKFVAPIGRPVKLWFGRYGEVEFIGTLNQLGKKTRDPDYEIIEYKCRLIDTERFQAQFKLSPEVNATTQVVTKVVGVDRTESCDILLCSELGIAGAYLGVEAGTLENYRFGDLRPGRLTVFAVAGNRYGKRLCSVVEGDEKVDLLIEPQYPMEQVARTLSWTDGPVCGAGRVELGVTGWNVSKKTWRYHPLRTFKIGKDSRFSTFLIPELKYEVRFRGEDGQQGSAAFSAVAEHGRVLLKRF